MTIQYMDGFDHYGVGEAGGRRMLEGLYLNAGNESGPGVEAAPIEPAFGARTGRRAFRVQAFSGTRAGGGSGNQARKAFPTPRNEVFVALGLYMETIPPLPQRYCCIGLRDSNNDRIVELMVETNGALKAVNGPFLDAGGTPNVIGQTSGPAIAAGAWNHLELRCNVTSGIVEVRLNEEEIIAVTGASLGSADVAAFIAYSIDMGFEDTNMYIDDLVLSDDQGTRNNTWNGDVRVATIFPDADGATSNWTNYPRQNIGDDIGFIENAENVFYRAGTDGQSDMALGTGDYTLEGFVRFWKLPGDGEQATLFAHWNDEANERGWRLFKGGPNVEGGKLVFEISTDGGNGTASKIQEITWNPRIGQWYHVAVCRDGGVNRLFIDGKQRGVNQPDSNDYFLPTSDRADPTIGAQQGTSEFSAEEAKTMLGFFDEVRWTVGVARYTANFTPPTTEFPRSVSGGDPDYDSTVVLLGFEAAEGETLTDQSFAATDWQAEAGATTIEPRDKADKYRTVNEETPIDDNYVSADFLPATAVLRVTQQPSATQTVTIGTTIYTFVTSLTSANDVLIGGDTDASIDNLVAAVNGAAGEGSTYGTGTVANPDATAEKTAEGEITFTASTQGSSGNTLTASETVSGAVFDVGGFTGGTDIPGPQDFLLGPLPPLTTQVLALQLTPRLSKIDSGSAKVQLSFRSPGGSGVSGGEKSLTVDEAYYTDVIETDPATSGDLTPTSIQTGLVRIERTV